MSSEVNIQRTAYSENFSAITPDCCFKWKIVCLITALTSSIIIVFLIIAYYPWSDVESTNLSDSVLSKFSKAAVVTNGAPCAEIARDILLQGGTAVDSMLAAMFCDGVSMPQSMGLGGGFFMVYYDRKKKKTYTINAREAAPLAATADMFEKNHTFSKIGSLSIAVPGELSGYWLAYNNFGGGVSWKDIIYPTIKLCETGIPINKHLAGLIPKLTNNENFRNLFINPKTGKFLTVDDTYKNFQLANTLRIIADEGPQAFYNGSIGDMLVNDIAELGGIITKEDLANYRARLETPVISTIFGKTLHTVGPPSSGIILSYILRLLKDLLPAPNELLNTQRITEAFKHGYGLRTRFGDPYFTNISLYMNLVQSEEYINEISKKIDDRKTSDNITYYGAEYYSPDDHGTGSLSLIADNGDAVAATSTINLKFGSKLISPSTGIILNDEMDDFSNPYSNAFKVKPSEPNFVAPGKRPLSSMCPSIVTDENGDVQLVIGAAGGIYITSSVALTIIRSLVFNKNIKEAIDMPMFHHQLIPMLWKYDYGIAQSVIEGMKQIGHEINLMPPIGYSCTNAIEKRNGLLLANSDFRREGSSAGY